MQKIRFSLNVSFLFFYKGREKSRAYRMGGVEPERLAQCSTAFDTTCRFLFFIRVPVEKKSQLEKSYNLFPCKLDTHTGQFSLIKIQVQNLFFQGFPDFCFSHNLWLIPSHQCPMICKYKRDVNISSLSLSHNRIQFLAPKRSICPFSDDNFLNARDCATFTKEKESTH